MALYRRSEAAQICYFERALNSPASTSRRDRVPGQVGRRQVGSPVLQVPSRRPV